MATEHSTNNDWRSAYCREQMMAKLDEAILHATMPLPIIGDGRSVENHIFNRSNSYERYINVIGKIVQAADYQRYSCKDGSYGGSTYVHPEQIGWQQQQSSMQMSSSLAESQRNFLMSMRLKRPVPTQMDYSASVKRPCNKRQADPTSNRVAAEQDTVGSEDKRKSQAELRKEVLIAQKKVLGLWERAALQQMEFRTVQLQMLQKMSDLMENINEKIQLMTPAEPN